MRIQEYTGQNRLHERIGPELSIAYATAKSRVPHFDRRLTFGVTAMPDSTNTSSGNAAPRLDIKQDNEHVFCFGNFRLLPARRLLLEGDKPLRLGSRALDILIALLERAGDLVTKDELMALVWPNTFVESANLTVHIAALRRGLGDGRDGNRFLINIPGRGYRFVAPVDVIRESSPSPPEAAAVPNAHNLPAHLTRLIGREDVVSAVAAQLCRSRFLTVVGPGGIGKTSAALAVAEKLIANYRDGTWLIDLAPVCDSLHVPAALASALGYDSRNQNTLAGVIATLRYKQMLLILDNCEHVVAAAADLVAGVLRGAPGVQVLATSREPLRTEGERIYRLPPLESPPAGHGISAEKALRFAAVQLFVERTAAALGEFVLDDADAPLVGDICRKLDGIPLAIEFAAARVNCFGIRGLAARLDDCMRLLTTGSRTKLPRQQTMRATLDWSYGLLTDVQQTVLRRLSIFSGEFSLRAAGAVASDESRASHEIVDHVTELVAKSLVATEADGDEPRLRLLQTTRVFALEKLVESGEFDAVVRRHAEYLRAQVPAQDKATFHGAPARCSPDIAIVATSATGSRRVSNSLSSRVAAPAPRIIA